MPKAYRYKSNGKYLKNTLFSTTNSDFLGAHHGVEADAIFDPVLAAIEEAEQQESHKQDFAVAFGIPADQIECEVIAGWDGDPATLPKEDEPDALVRLPVAPEPPPPPTFEELVAQASTFAELKKLVAEQLA